jgi:four helix bundle protein
MIQKNSYGQGAAAKPRSHRDLLVWQKAMDFAVEVYRLAAKFPGREAYGLTSQITRACASVPANIAEGRGRASRKDFANFLAIAKGSLMESETLIELAVRLGYLPSAEARPALNLVTEISKMLTKLRSRLLEAKDTEDISSAA